MTCWAPRCEGEIVGRVVWLEDDAGNKYPFHPDCANGAWPMSECDPPAEGVPDA